MFDILLGTSEKAAMLADRASPVPFVAMTAVSEDGLTVSVDGAEAIAPWSSVLGVTAGIAKHNDADILLLAIEVGPPSEDRVLLLRETDPLWQAMTALLPDQLPGAIAFERWAPYLLAGGGPLNVYWRAS